MTTKKFVFKVSFEFDSDCTVKKQEINEQFESMLQDWTVADPDNGDEFLPDNVQVEEQK